MSMFHTQRVQCLHVQRSLLERILPLACVLALMHGLRASAQPNDWITFTDETWRILSPPDIGGSSDTAEKDMAVGDLDLDNRVDLVVVRKDQFYGPNPKRNILIHEQGVGWHVETRRLDVFSCAGHDGHD